MLMEIGLGLGAFLLYLYYKLSKNKNYWSDRGVPHTTFHFFWGNDKEVYQGKISRHEKYKEEYFEFPGEPLYGRWSLFGVPHLVLRNDFDLIRSIWIKDFDQFNETIGGQAFSKLWQSSREERLTVGHVANLHGDAWKGVRSTFTPIFTSGKLKQMLPLLEEINSKLEYYVKSSVQSKEDVELKDLMGRFSMSAIASCAFGVDSGSFTNEGSQSEFVKQAKKMFQGDFLSKILITITILTPNRVKQIFSGLGFKNFPPAPNLKENTFFQNVVEATIKQRKESKRRRNDLVDLMIDATEGKLDSTEDESDKYNNNGLESNSMNPSAKKIGDLGYDNVISTAVILLLAGYDTTGTTMSYILYQLALNQDCQNVLFEEIERNTNSTGELSYDAIQSLPYLEAVIHETLRRHPVLAMLERPCTKDYKLPNTDLVVEKGMRVRLNNVGICFDPEIYPKPEEWNPDNFLKENRAKRNPYSFMAFSLGPRNCLAMRFAMFEMKVAISHVVSKFKILATPKTCKNVQVDPKHMLGAAKEGLWIQFEERK